MSHPFGDLLTQYLHRKHGLSQARLAAGILQTPSIISEMCQGKRLSGSQARNRVTAIIGWLQQQGALTTLDEANALLNAADMSPLREHDATETTLLHQSGVFHGPNLIQTKSTFGQTPFPVTPAAHSLPRHNLPPQLTPFIGRTEQIEQLVQQLQTHRLLTLTGAGGVGKTRLAIEAATRLCAGFADGVLFVDLAPLTDPATVPQRMLALCRLPEQPDHPPLTTLTAFLSAKQFLLILDNCEHLIGACAELAETILRNCPQVYLLATSREALNIGGETAWRVPSLTRPRASAERNDSTASSQAQFAPEALMRFEAVALFAERAQRHNPGFVFSTANAPAVAHICSRLDGIPLALEMAAARVNVFTVEEIAARLDGALDARFQLLTNGARTAPFRHQTLRAILEWSYALLTPAEQRLLAHLAVFHGGWTAGAVEAVTGCTLDLLAQLVNKSLVVADQRAGQTRYRLLETVRQFAAEQLRSEEQRQIWNLHSRYYLHLLSEQEGRLSGPQQRNGLEVIRTDFENFGAAWHWAVEQHEVDLLYSAAHAFFLFCDATGSFRTGVTLFAQLVAELQSEITVNDSSQASLKLLLGQALIRFGACKVRLFDLVHGEQLLQDGLLYVTKQQERAFALLHLGISAAERGESTLQVAYLHECLEISRRCNDTVGTADALLNFHLGSSEYPEVCRQGAESLALWRQVGRPDRIACVMNQLAWHTWCAGDYAAASAYWHEGLALCQELDLPNEKAWALDCLGFAAWSQGDSEAAERHIQEALSTYTALSRQSSIGMCKAELALVLASVGRVEQAISLAQEAVAITRAVNSQMMLTMSLNYLGAVLIVIGNLAAARRALVEAIQRAWKHCYLYNLMNAFYYVAELLVVENRSLDSSSALERKALAAAVLSFVRCQTATWHFFKDKAARLQADIEQTLPTGFGAAAIARGQSCTLEEMVSAVMKTIEAG